MAQQSWMNLLNAGAPWQTTNGAALTSSATTATISPQAPTTQDFVLPSQYNGLQFYPGMTLWLRARGVCNAGATTSNLTLFFAAGVSGTLATTLTTSGALTLGTTITTSVGWRAEAIIRCTGIGSSGNTLAASGDWILSTAAGANTGTLGTSNSTIMTMAETTTALNTYTSATAIGLRATLSAAFGSVQCNEFLVMQLA